MAERIGRSAGPRLPEAVKLSERLGYEQAWYSDCIVACATRGDGSAITITQYEGGPLCVNIGAGSRHEALAVSWKFRRAFGLKFVELT